MTVTETKSIAAAKLPIIILLALGWILGGVTAFTLQSGAATGFPDSQLESPARVPGVQLEQLAQVGEPTAAFTRDPDAGRSAGLVMPGALLLGRGVGRVWR